MRPLSLRLVRNLAQPVQLWRWWKYQRSRKGHNDFFLITMPSSGTHWVRLLLSKALIDCYDLPDALTTIHETDLLPTHRSKQARFKYNDRLDIPRIQHSHAFYSWLYKNKNVILLVRDLRDAMVSHYKIRTTAHGYQRPFGDFLRGVDVDTRRCHTLQSRCRFLNGWWKKRAALNSLLILRFEDLKQDTRTVVQRLLAFCQFPPVDDTALEAIMEFCSLEHMKQMEQAHPHPRYENKAQKISAGKSGSYKDFFAPEDIEYFNRYTQNHLICQFGYEYETG